MPEQVYPDHAVNSINRGRPTHLEILQLPPNRPRSPGPPRSALSPSTGPSRRHHRNRKNVRWDPSIKDNEHKMLPRSQKSAPAERPLKSSVKPSNQPASPTLPTTITPKKINPAATRQQPNYNYNKSMRPMSPSPLQNSRAPAHRPAYTEAGANSASRRVLSPSPRCPTKIRKTLPAVPDASRSHCPPPAPRPARLPTPDLPEIEESKFFVPKDKLFDYHWERGDARGRPVHLKTDDQRR
jgi:hypothetical protein